MVFLIITIIVTRNIDSSRDLPELELTLGAYDNPITVVSGMSDYKTQYIGILNESDHLYTDMRDANLSDFILQKVRYYFNIKM